jgi:hypothetical protein
VIDGAGLEPVLIVDVAQAIDPRSVQRVGQEDNK